MSLSRSVAALAVGLALTLLGSFGATAVAAPPPPGRPAAVALVGQWTARVDTGSGVVEAVLSFSPGGRLCLVEEPGPDGGVEGTGRWIPAGRSAFGFVLNERFFDGAGRTTFRIVIDQRGALSGANAWRTTGTARFFDANGRPTGSSASTVTATRLSDRPARC